MLSVSSHKVCRRSCSCHSLWLVSWCHPCKGDTNITSVVAVLRLRYRWLTREMLVRAQLWNTCGWILSALTRWAHTHFPMSKWSWHHCKHDSACTVRPDTFPWEHKGHLCTNTSNLEHTHHTKISYSFIFNKIHVLHVTQNMTLTLDWELSLLV